MRWRYAGSRIGIDLDNTLITYDRLFRLLAAERRLVDPGFAGGKRVLRDVVRRLPNGEVEWRRLQAIAYGPRIGAATAAEGASDFIHRARDAGAELTIVSHKSAYSNLGESRVDLRGAALDWLRTNGLIGPDAIPEHAVYFEETRSEKIARIRALDCSHFIDDLEEVFDDPAFPDTVERIFLSAHGDDMTRAYRSYPSFRSISDAFDAY